MLFRSVSQSRYNIDDFAENSAIPTSRFSSNVSSILPFKNWRKDYLSSIKPSPLYASVTPKSLTPNISNVESSGAGRITSLQVQIAPDSTETSFSAADIRNLIATEKLAQ